MGLRASVRLGVVLLVPLVFGCGRTGDLAAGGASASGDCGGGCPSGQTCTNGACAPSSTTGSGCDCAADETCVDGACVPSTTPTPTPNPTPTPTGACGTDGASCPPMTTCTNGQCCLAGSPLCFPPLMSCSSARDCAPGETCQLGFCLPSGLGGGGGGGGGIGGIGGGGGGGSGGTGGGMCTTASDCPSGDQCLFGFCLPGAPGGGPPEHQPLSISRCGPARAEGRLYPRGQKVMLSCVAPLQVWSLLWFDAP